MILVSNPDVYYPSNTGLAQRLKKLTETMPDEPDGFICALIPADRQRSLPTHREYIEGSITEVRFPVPASNPLVLKYAAIVLQCENVIEISKFNDRDPTVTDWYYQAYAADSESPAMRSPSNNSIVNIFKSPRTHHALGDVLIMKNGPTDGPWESSANVNIPSLARTIWWYRGSGQDISTVFGERGLIRVIGDMKN